MGYDCIPVRTIEEEQACWLKPMPRLGLVFEHDPEIDACCADQDDRGRYRRRRGHRPGRARRSCARPWRINRARRQKKPHRINCVRRKKGQVAKSQDFTTGIVFALSVAVL